MRHTVEIKVTGNDSFLARYDQESDAAPGVFELKELCWANKYKDGIATYMIDITKLIPMVTTSYMFNILFKRIQIEVTNEWFARKRAEENKD